ncbi:MAG TPA: DNA repair protein RecN [Thermoanaerobaculia bacterium]|nr:DNA repair protein RecN [Thermoanaerobaculia bacterium]
MLCTLRVRDLAVLEDVDVALDTGLTVLTGETGAGKSLVVDALSLLSGERSDATLVRAGAERLVVEGSFETDDPAVTEALVAAGLREPDTRGAAEVVVRREVSSGGKGRLFIDGSPAALRTLAGLAPRLLVLYGQAEARELLDPAAPRELLDRFAALLERSAEVERLHAAWKESDADRARIAALGKDGPARLEVLEFRLAEIDRAAPVAGEEESLGREKAALSSVEKRGRLLADAVASLESDEGGALPALTALRRTLLALAEVDPDAAGRLATVDDLIERVADVAASTSRDLDRLEADPSRLATVVERLDVLAKLKRKYGASLEEVLAYREVVGRERDELADLEGALRKAEKAAGEAFAAYRTSALELSAARTAAAPRLGRAVEKQLSDLAFLSSSFRVEVSRKGVPDSPFLAGEERVAFGPHGVDAVTLAFAPNPGEPPRPLAKIASGGELSRVQLAVAAALAEAEAAREGKRGSRRGGPVRTFVFDEVDAGVSGATAEAVGRKLRALADREQILVVTHLAQVAAAGDRHLAVRKEVSGGRTRTVVTDLDEKGRVEAIAALLAGASLTDAARRQARQLLAAAAETSRSRS